MHFLIRAGGYQTLTTHIFRERGPLADGPYFTLSQRFVLAPQTA